MIHGSLEILYNDEIDMEPTKFQADNRQSILGQIWANDHNLTGRS